MTKVDIWMPLYVADYLGDTSRLTTEQHGAYLLLLMDYWRNGPPPDDDLVLAQITRMTLDAWSNARASIEHFFSVENGKWTQKRVEQELSQARDKKEVQTARAKAAAKKRWDKENAASNATSIPQAVLMQCPSPSPSPSPNKTLKQERTSAPVCPQSVDEQVWKDYLAVRKAKRSPVTETAIQAIEKEAGKAGWSLEKALRECVARGWVGFKAEWVDKLSNQKLSFAERDELLKRKRWEEMTGREFPEETQSFWTPDANMELLK
jgi:uncharacterized protein YdaU (DUF1376 family)